MHILQISLRALQVIPKYFLLAALWRLIQCLINGFNVPALIDTGSMKSFVSQDVFDLIKPIPVWIGGPHQCVGITGQPFDICGAIQLDLSFSSDDSVSYPGTYLVSSNLLHSLQYVLGWDFLTSNDLSLSVDEIGAYFLVGLHGSTPLSPHSLPPLAPGSDYTGGQSSPSASFLVQSMFGGLFLLPCHHRLLYQVEQKY